MVLRRLSNWQRAGWHGFDFRRGHWDCCLHHCVYNCSGVHATSCILRAPGTKQSGREAHKLPLYLVTNAWSIFFTPTNAILPSECHVFHAGAYTDARWGHTSVPVTYKKTTEGSPPLLKKGGKGLGSHDKHMNQSKGHTDCDLGNILFLKIALMARTHTAQYEVWMLQKGMEAGNDIARNFETSASLLLLGTCSQLLVP